MLLAHLEWRAVIRVLCFTVATTSEVSRGFISSVFFLPLSDQTKGFLSFFPFLFYSRLGSQLSSEEEQRGPTAASSKGIPRLCTARMQRHM